jgi:hypothetical protein
MMQLTSMMLRVTKHRSENDACEPKNMLDSSEWMLDYAPW